MARRRRGAAHTLAIAPDDAVPADLQQPPEGTQPIAQHVDLAAALVMPVYRHFLDAIAAPLGQKEDFRVVAPVVDAGAAEQVLAGPTAEALEATGDVRNIPRHQPVAQPGEHLAQAFAQPGLAA